MKRAVVLFSGGLDSSTTLAIAKSQGYEIYALSFDYGQRHIIELESACRSAVKYGVKKHLTVNFNLRDIGGSALTGDIEVPKSSAKVQPCNSAEDKNSVDGLHEPDVIPVTYVPARNTVFLSFALAWAETLEAEDIFIGVNAVDYSGYPDCRPELIHAFENMANLATKVSVEGTIRFRVRAPLLRLTKAEIVKKGSDLGVDFAMTWSCYDPVKEGRGENDEEGSRAGDRTGYKPCTRCDSCRLRAKGFEEAGVRDPLLCLRD